MLTIAVVVVLCAWFVITAIVQLPSAFGRQLRRYDPIGHLLPGWNFFAPKPIQGDFAVWYRSWSANAQDREEVLEAGATGWRELAGIDQRRISDALVNPGRYPRKSIFGCCHAIVRAMKHLGYEQGGGPELPPDPLMMSLPYLLLAEKVTALCRGAVAVQFRIDVIGYDRGAAQSHAAFRSAVHRVPRSDRPDQPAPEKGLERRGAAS